MSTVIPTSPRSAPHIRTTYWFWVINLVFMLAWTIVPLSLRPQLPLDSLEAVNWGQFLTWGYDRNPYFNAWLARGAVTLSQGADWGIYFTSRLSVLVCFWAVWRLGLRMMSSERALVAVVILTAINFFTTEAIDLNDNVIELGLWSLTILYFYQALQDRRTRDWILTGLWAGLAMMTKYYTAILLLCMFAFLLSSKSTRLVLRQRDFYLSGIVFLIIIMPHLYWLSQHNFVTMGYALNQMDTQNWLAQPSFWESHFVNPFNFALQIILLSLGAAFLFLFVLGKRISPVSPKPVLNHFNKKFLIYLSLGPFIVTLLIGLIGGSFLKVAWGQPLLSLWGLLLVGMVQPEMTPPRWKRLLIASSVVFILMLVAYMLYYTYGKGASSRTFYPGRDIAAYVEAKWERQYHSPLPMVVGTRWEAGSVSHYAHANPPAYLEADPNILPITDDDVRQSGAVFVWNTDIVPADYLSDLAQRFEGLYAIELLSFPSIKPEKNAPVNLGIAYLAPLTPEAPQDDEAG